MKRDCHIDGHVTVDHDPECIACGDLITVNDLIGLNVDRDRGALADTRDIAEPSEWGHAATAPD